MKTNKKTQNIIIYIAVVIGVIGLILGSMHDRGVTQRLGNSNNLFGILFSAIAIIPTLSLGCFAGSALVFSPKQNNNVWDKIMRILGIVFVILMYIFQIKEGFEYAEYARMANHEKLFKVILIVFTTITYALIIFLTRKFIAKLDNANLVPTCLIMMAVIVGYAACTEVIKYLVSRPRPRLVLNGIEEYREWYQFKPFFVFKHKDCKSFVSGHTANAACLITLFPLFFSLTKWNDKKVQICSSIVGLLFCIVSGGSRVIATAHYLSDVTGALIVSSIVQLIVLNVGFLIVNKVKSNEK